MDKKKVMERLMFHSRPLHNLIILNNEVGNQVNRLKEKNLYNNKRTNRDIYTEREREIREM